ncbi:hypothetical protein ASPVEDRAFT_37039 [Aspergillus versicolor CBS 583.65]|uniref:N-acetyltransferase domain-containing protein n=1 Tax=Aspergillus versicolor CBS 583.65 TaxID=1036611 RepID=A0A1L9P7V8_ASPVE|nr:uncharacterized protein ASPVEDRAFT_37039 [Aspergillus versicolor CBS 583.65]OJI97620.1 hypothetical protein ASPVEDRAFT_37039 [Aspergillus versicolor CBS 583.65]
MTRPVVTTLGPEHAERVAEVIAAAFSTSLFTSYLLRTPESTWPTDNIPAGIVGAHFKKSVTSRAEQGAELVEAGNFAAVAVWFPPGNPISTAGVTDPRILEYREKFSQVKKEHLQDRDYWYLNLIGRHPERTEPGVVRALVDPYFKKAREQGVPLYLEAISEHARDVYEHLEFRTIAAVRLGVGRTNARGELDENGEGIMLYGMMAE